MNQTNLTIKQIKELAEIYEVLTSGRAGIAANMLQQWLGLIVLTEDGNDRKETDQNPV